MTKTDERFELRKTLKIGSICITTYMLSYYMRNILSVTTPEMLENGDFTKEFIATLSSLYMIAYAGGQLVNGIIGDITKPKYMVSLGLALASLSLTLFPFFTSSSLQIMCFLLLGFGFSMLRGPIVKIVSENTKQDHARICCVLLSVACYFGPLVSGLMAMFMPWKPIFIVSGIIALTMAILSFVTLSILEKSGLIVPIESDNEKKKTGIFSVFFLDNFIVYMLIGGVVEMTSFAISFWLPTYMNEYLGFPANVSGAIYSVVSLVKSIGPFLSLFIFKWFRENDMRSMRIMFLISTIFFVGMAYITNIWVNLLFLLIALLTNCCAAGIMWSIYIPGLASSGKVSSANGILDCTGYAAAAVATSCFAFVMENFGWTETILVWAGISILGALLTIFGKKSNFKERM